MTNEKTLLKNDEYNGPTLDLIVTDYGRHYSKVCSECGRNKGPEDRIDIRAWNYGLDVNGKHYTLSDYGINRLRQTLENDFYLEKTEFSNEIRSNPKTFEKKLVKFLEFIQKIPYSKWYSGKTYFKEEKVEIRVKEIKLEEKMYESKHYQDSLIIQIYPEDVGDK